MVQKAPSLLVVSPSSPIKSLKDLIDAAKKNPQGVTYGSAGVGTAGHINGHLVNVAARVAAREPELAEVRDAVARDRAEVGEKVRVRLGVRDDQVGASLYALLDKSGNRPVRAIQRIRAVSVGAEDAKLLDVETGAAVLQIERTSYLASGRVIEFTRSVYRGDTYDFVAELRIAAEGGSRK